MAIPQEVEWNIIKFMSHPCADLLRPIIEDYDSYNYDCRRFDEYCFDTGLKKINTRDPSTWTPDYLEEKYDNMINGRHARVKVGRLAWPPARVLKQMDPVAYQRGMQEYLDSRKEDYNDEIYDD